jgi:hypothetical protein
VNVCTIVARNYLAHARVIASSFREHHPDRRFWTLILDAPESADRAHEPFRSLMAPRPASTPPNTTGWPIDNVDAGQYLLGWILILGALAWMGRSAWSALRPLPETRWSSIAPSLGLDLHAEAMSQTIPIPPAEIRELVGPTEPEAFDNPDHQLVYPYLEPAVYESVFDFGCGCGRVARQQIQQDPNRLATSGSTCTAA